MKRLPLILFAFSFLQNKVLASSDEKFPIYDKQHNTVIGYYSRFQDDTLGHLKTTYYDHEGKEAVKEFLNTEKQGFVTYEINQQQLSAAVKVNINPDVVLFERTDTTNNKKKTATEARKENSIAPLQLAKFIQSNIEKLKEGGKIPIYIASWERLELVKMTLKKSDQFPFPSYLADKDIIVIEMRPANFIIAQLVNPFYFRFNLKEQKITHMLGRIPLKKRNGGKWEDQEGVVWFVKKEAP
ncbi:MAG: hypothetical protein NZ480_06340 [Bdellovibrionaceae bacterium]|nr:hypothetical protein [Pseudobdellovibrionaceae bacterium]MDW8189367.1 hypothetical protein [Pseudobdellovibrionaceae bacterium]